MDTTPKPPEWWTTENTEAWTREQWDNLSERSQAMREWGYKITGNVQPARSRAALLAVIPPELMAQWRVNDPRPSATHYYDGRPIERYQPLKLKKTRKPRKAVAA